MPDETTNPSEEQIPQTPEAAGAPETPSDADRPAPAEGGQADAAEAPAEEGEAADQLPPNEVKIEDAGTLRKKITVTVPRARIDAKFAEMFGELAHSAQVPGFRIGRAPRRLIEKRFGKEVGEDVRNKLVGEALQKVLEKGSEVKAVGDPDLKLEEIELPDKDDMSFSFEVEVAPEFELPSYVGIRVERPKADITDERVEEALAGFRGQFGVLRPVDGPAREGDTVVTDVTVAGEGIEAADKEVELRVGPSQVHGIPLEELGKTLAGKAAGESAELTTKVPAGHPDLAWREKDVTITFTVHEVKRLELPPIGDELAGKAGFDSMEEMRAAIRRNLDRRAQTEVWQAMRDQVAQYLMGKTKLDVPQGAAERHAAGLLQRRAVDLMMRGVPREQIEANLQRLKDQADAQAAQELKLSFILSDIAEIEKIGIQESEVNSRIASIAAQQNRRPERLKSEMIDSGQYQQLATAIVEEKTIDHILQMAEIVWPGEQPAAEPAPGPQEGQAVEPPPGEADKADEQAKSDAKDKP